MISLPVCCGTAWQSVLSRAALPRSLQKLLGSGDQGINLLDYVVDQRSFFVMRGCGNMVGVLALSGIFGSVAEVVGALCWFIPHILVSDSVVSASLFFDSLH